MQYLEIRNWRDFQHYKDRNPPWIKLHYALITSHDWVMWDDHCKLLAIACMMIASRNHGQIPADENYIQRVAHLQKKPDLKPLIDSGFFVDASALLADATTKKRRDREETEDTQTRLGDFPAFWSRYPSKVGKDKAKPKYEAALRRASHEEIMAGLENYLKSEKVAKGFVQNPATWLNGGHWQDEYGASNKKEAVSWVKAQG